MTAPRQLTTRRGTIPFPAYIPVTTFGDKYPLDNLVRPYLPRLAPAVMVSLHYARKMDTPPPIPLLIDSGGFAALFEGSNVVSSGDLGLLELSGEEGKELIHPKEVLELQEQLADVAFSLDFPIPPNTPKKEAHRRLDLTIANAHWALANRRRRDLCLYACIQAWDATSARTCARAYAQQPFDGVAIGGLVPRARDTELLLSIIEAVRQEIGDCPLHVFGLGKPQLTESLFKAGVDSVDSSSYVKLAADGRLWSDPEFRITDPSPTDRLHLALCNLATAASSPLPLSASHLAFSTYSLSGPRATLVS